MQPFFDVVSELGGLAMSSRRINVAASVFQLLPRHPIALAQAVVTLDDLLAGGHWGHSVWRE